MASTSERWRLSEGNVARTGHRAGGAAEDYGAVPIMFSTGDASGSADRCRKVALPGYEDLRHNGF